MNSVKKIKQSIQQFESMKDGLQNALINADEEKKALEKRCFKRIERYKKIINFFNDIIAKFHSKQDSTRKQYSSDIKNINKESERAKRVIENIDNFLK